MIMTAMVMMMTIYVRLLLPWLPVLLRARTQSNELCNSLAFQVHAQPNGTEGTTCIAALCTTFFL